MSKLITPESPLLVPPLLAAEIGLEEAMILQQIHYFVQISSHEREDGRIWFWKTLNDWGKTMPFLKLSKIRRAIANLKDIFKLIDVKRHSEATWYQANWFTINVEAVKALWERIAQNEQIESDDLDTSMRSPQGFHSIDTSSENYSSSLFEEQKENETFLKSVAEVREEISDDANSKTNSSSNNLDPLEDKSSAPCSEVPKKRTKGQAEVWEIAAGSPYPVFLNWRADKHYKPQGGKWESDAHGIAYSEFYNNRAKTTAVLFPQFLEYMKTVAENCNQQVVNGIKAILPSCFIARPEASQENVQQLMGEIQQLVDDGVQVALPNPGAPSSTQSMSFAAATECGIIKPLPILQQPILTVSERECVPNVVEPLESVAQSETKSLPNPVLEGMRGIFKTQLKWDIDDTRLQWFLRIQQPERSLFWSKLKAQVKKASVSAAEVFDNLRRIAETEEEEKEITRVIAWCWLLSLGVINRE